MRRVRIIANIVLCDLEKIDTPTAESNKCFLHSLDDIQTIFKKDFTYVVNTKEFEKAAALSGNLFIPYSLFRDNRNNVQALVYFELEAFPFFESFTQIINSENTPKGVLRFRRAIRKENFHYSIVGDLYVFSSLFGEPLDIHLKKTDEAKVPRHIIIMIDFGGGTFAHIEYTVSDQEKIELEWSGVKNIIEFDSDQMKPIIPRDKTFSPLTYSVEAILSSARVLDEEIILQLEDFQRLLDGGVKK